MRNVKLRVELNGNGIDKGHRYVVRIGDGIHSELMLLANTTDKYSSGQWTMLLGTPQTTSAWASSTNEGMYVTITRQYPNSDFDFQPESYKEEKWLENQIEVAEFRLYNPFLARPFLQWKKSNERWDGDEIPFSEGDQHQFHYDIHEWDYEKQVWWSKNETGINWTVRRNDDSDDYKEFVIKLSV